MISALHSGLCFPSTDCTSSCHSLQVFIHLNFNELVAAMPLLTLLGEDCCKCPAPKHNCRGKVPPSIVVSRVSPWFNGCTSLKTASPQVTGESDSANMVLLHWVFHPGGE